MNVQQQLIEKANAKGFKLEFHDDIEKGRELHYWYGGVVATITDQENGDEYELVANGDIWAKYYDENGDEQVFVKDKRNAAQFYSDMMDDVSNDDCLIELANNWHEEKYPALEIENNNWFELFSLYNDERSEIEEVMSEDKYSNAVEEAIDLIIDFKKQD